MIKILKLASAYMKFYKKQTISIFLGIILSAVLISGIGSLIYSGRKADLETARKDNGDWHYQISNQNNLAKELTKKQEGSGYIVEKYGEIQVKKIVDEPYQVTFCSADSNYFKMMGRTLLTGKYPVKEDDIAMDYHTINNLGISDQIGNTVEVCGSKYILSEIIAEGPADSAGDMKVFVSSDKVLDSNISLIYVKFNESQKVYTQLESFAKEHKIELQNVARNNAVTSYVGGDSGESIAETFWAAFSNQDAGLVYFLGSLNESIGLMDKAIFMALVLFAAFIIYSLYGITIEKRKAEYAVLQVIGLEEKHLFFIMLTELLLIIAVGYPIGCIIGNTIARLLYSNIAYMFSAQGDGTIFYVSISTMKYGAIFFLGFIILISLSMVRKMNQQTAAQLMKTSAIGKNKNRNIYAKKNRSLIGILTKRFMFGRWSTFISIIISLSLGGILFLGTSYAAESTRVNMNHKFETDDGINSDLAVYIDSDNGTYSIPAKAVEEIKQIKGVAEVGEMSYSLGEMPLEQGVLRWPEFFKELNNDPNYKQDQRIIDNYNGVITREGTDSYRMKVNVYGYSDEMLNNLNDYLIAGTININNLKDENSVILKNITAGQGNTDGLAINTGDTIKLKVPKTMDNAESLKFKSDDNEYIEKEFKVAAIVNRPIAKNNYFIGDDGSDTVDIIMPCDMMREYFKVNGYNVISVKVNDKADGSMIAQQIRSKTIGLNRCMIKDFTEEIMKKNNQLNQKVYFFYGIAAILICISLLHIVNSMKHIVFSKKHEFGIIRAMGITDNGFRTMMVGEGVRYGIYTSICMFILYFIVQRFLYFIMKKVLLYIVVENNIMVPQCLFISAINILICTLTFFIAGNSILKEEIIKEI